MAVKPPFKVEMLDVFPDGAGALHVRPKPEFGSKEQAHDKETGWPLWVVTVTDREAVRLAREDDKNIVSEVVKVNVPGKHKPVLPKAPDGVQDPLVEFTGLRLMPYTKKESGNVFYSLRAEGVEAADSIGKSPAPRKEAA